MLHVLAQNRQQSILAFQAKAFCGACELACATEIQNSVAHGTGDAPQNSLFLWRTPAHMRHRIFRGHLHVGPPRAAPFFSKFPSRLPNFPRARPCTSRRRSPFHPSPSTPPQLPDTGRPCALRRPAPLHPRTGGARRTSTPRRARPTGLRATAPRRRAGHLDVAAPPRG